MSRIALLAQAIKRMVWYGTAGPFRETRKSRVYWETLVWTAANAPLPERTGILPVAEVEEIVPEARDVACDLREYLPVNGNLLPVEMTALARIVKALAPGTIFEFGTFNGGTTLQMAVNSPDDARIHTLDLPPDSPLRGNTEIVDITPTVVGERFLATPWATKISLHLADSAHFDTTPFKGAVDLAFVDASHVEQYVESDTKAALSMLAPGGTILWHDYADYAPGVVNVLDRLRAQLPIHRLADTSLAIYRAPAAGRR